jgi:hypothetical protein
MTRAENGIRLTFAGAICPTARLCGINSLLFAVKRNKAVFLFVSRKNKIVFGIVSRQNEFAVCC